VRNCLEFHDSTLSAISADGTSVRISINAYVHSWSRVGGTWKGTGWLQPVQIILKDATNVTSPSDLPVGLGSGSVRASETTHDNVVPLPFTRPGPATLRLDLVTREVLEIKGRDIVIESTGDAIYVEDLPDDFRPADDA
jgi:hypothetical protein